MEGIYEDVLRKANPFIESYRDDLLVHDKREIAEHPGVPFLHFTGETGTSMAMFRSAESYPTGLIKYLFGFAVREEILESEISVVKDMSKRYGRGKLILHYDGKSLKQITQEQANDIAADYKRAILSTWKMQKKLGGQNGKTQ